MTLTKFSEGRREGHLVDRFEQPHRDRNVV
jgi:hypothetical protein